jgi:hypothetical protein
MVSAAGCPGYWRLVSPKGVLMYVYDHEALKQLANEHHGKLFNFEHLVGVAAGNCERPDHVQGFRTFEHVQWLASSGGPGANRLIPNYQPRLVYVYGSPAEWCGEMARSEPDMPFTWGTLRKLLSKTLTSHGRLKTEYTVFQWHLVDRPEDAEVRMPTSTDPRYAPPAVVTRAAVTRALAEKDAECARAEKEQERADRTEREREHLAAQLQALDDERQDELMVADNDFEMVEVQQELQVRTAPPCPARPCSLQHHCP